ncbi:phosphatidate cytidylyltransferase [Congregibacter sp.]|uniref:phosphatidate cytidylyltransferase n=1 Tax=Congregibacter sp. TaxID=2744308 RepID=UPI0038589378
MLKQRVLTAIPMAGLFLAGAYWLPVPALAIIFLVIIALGAWEWAPMAGLTKLRSKILYVTLVVACAGALYRYAGDGQNFSRELVQPILGLTCLWWCFALLWVKSFPASSGLWDSRLGRSFMGVLILVPAWFAAIYLLKLEPRSAVMVALVLVVATADIGAYFTGKAFGRHALSPQVSPGKTWEGFWGGVLAVAVLAVVIWSLLPERLDHLSLVATVVVVLTTAFSSVLGDLTVSMVKRVGGVKDSSSMLPGHGGLLDRLDSLCAATPTFALGLVMVGF